jgi:hypothetical protein
MGGEKWLGLRLSFFDETVAAFEPAKVVRLLERKFPGAEVDPTDHDQVRLEQLLALWSRDVADPELRKSLVQQAWGSYRRNGPSYRFVVPFMPQQRVRGQARRLSVGFWLPSGLAPEHHEQLRAFLVSLRMGVLELDDCEEDEAKLDATEDSRRGALP